MTPTRKKREVFVVERNGAPIVYAGDQCVYAYTRGAIEHLALRGGETWARYIPAPTKKKPKRRVRR